jgi:hypothetical protein
MTADNGFPSYDRLSRNSLKMYVPMAVKCCLETCNKTLELKDDEHSPCIDILVVVHPITILVGICSA